MSARANRPRLVAAWLTLVATLAILGALACGPLARAAGAEGLSWRLEQPQPPEPEPGVQASSTPVGLGRVGDIEFWAPNKGLLITDGNGSTVPPGVWAYNGQGWHEIANKCGATDGRIAWAGPDEFWTVSDGRSGQAANRNGVLPPLEDNTLCRFAKKEPSEPKSPLEIVKSYATLGFQANSYQAMHAAACVSATDCWFAGDPLPSPQVGAFHLHWNGSSLEPEPNTRVETIRSMSVFEKNLYEADALPLEESGESEHTIEEIEHPAVLQQIAPEGSSSTFQAIRPRSARNEVLPEYAFGSYPRALGALHLSSDEDSLWAAAGPVAKPPAGSEPAKLTVLRDSGGTWSQVLGPPVSETVKADSASFESDVVNSIAAEPASSNAWIALDSQEDAQRPEPTVSASLAHVSANGSVSEEQLPTTGETQAGIGPKGAAYRVVCPAKNDCWTVTTQGWLFHLSEAGDRTLPANGDQAFEGSLITYRPPDEGLPQVQSDAPPADDSGLDESQAANAAALTVQVTPPNTFAEVTVPLVSDEHTRIVHGTTLDFTFHLAVKARVRLIAKRSKSVVAKTAMLTLKGGSHSIQLKLNRRRWPTKLELQTHALAPLPKASTKGKGVESVSTSETFLNGLGLSGWGSRL